MKTYVPSAIRGVLWRQLLEWGTKGEVHVSLKEYGTPLDTDSRVFVVNFEQISYWCVFEIIFKILIRLEYAYSNEKFILKECHP